MKSFVGWSFTWSLHPPASVKLHEQQKRNLRKQVVHTHNHNHTHTHTHCSPSRAAAAVTARLVPALVRPLRPLAQKPGFSKPLLKPLPVYKQGQTERQAWLAGMYSCFAFPSSTFSKLAFCSSSSWPHWGLWPPSGSAPSSPPLLPAGGPVLWCASFGELFQGLVQLPLKLVHHGLRLAGLLPGWLVHFPILQGQKPWRQCPSTPGVREYKDTQKYSRVVSGSRGRRAKTNQGLSTCKSSKAFTMTQASSR